MQFADRLSLTVSGLMIGGLLLVGLALTLQDRAGKPVPSRPVPAPAVQPAAPERDPTALLLPPPPRSPNAPVAARNPQASARQPVTPPRIVEPLRSSAPQATGMPPAIVPLQRKTPAATVLKTEISDPAPPAVDARAHRTAGGALLRLLEHGKGPTIEIGWPRSAADRLTLFRTLTGCYGMRLAVLDGNSRLFGSTGPAAQPWDIDRDRFSGFLRSPQGESIPEESHTFSDIALRHGLSGWRPVRVFPRDVDAALLGGLGQLLGPRYRTARSIRAVYDLSEPGLTLTGFRIDGRAVGGTIELAPSRRGCG